jgi:DNA-damage-inducible protein D
MNELNKLAVFEDKHIRQLDYNGETYFSVVDIIEALTNSSSPKTYWSMLKKKEIQSFNFLEQLKFQSSDGKFYKSDAANTEGVLRIIQSVPSPKAEPFKLWLANLGKQQLDEIDDPELGFERLRAFYLAKGHDDKWIERRLKSIHIRKELTDEWQKRGITEGADYSKLTAEISRGTFDMTPIEYRAFKGLAETKDNLRDHMTDLELVFTMLGEAATTEIARNRDSQGVDENLDAAVDGGIIAGNARRELERKSGNKVSTKGNFKHLTDGEKAKIEDKND